MPFELTGRDRFAVIGHIEARGQAPSSWSIVFDPSIPPGSNSPAGNAPDPFPPDHALCRT